MREQASVNKTAWEYRAYEFWMQQDDPAVKAGYIRYACCSAKQPGDSSGSQPGGRVVQIPSRNHIAG